MLLAKISSTIESNRSCSLANIMRAENQTLKNVSRLANAYPLNKVQRRVGEKLIQPRRYAIKPTNAETNAVTLKYNAMRPNTRSGGSMSKVNKPSEIITISKMLMAKRAGM